MKQNAENPGEPGGTRTHDTTLGSVTYGKHEQAEPIKPIIQPEAAT
jgi:hypothetical protein